MEDDAKEGCRRKEKERGDRAVMWEERRRDAREAWFLRLGRRLWSR